MVTPGAIAKSIVPPNDDMFVICVTEATNMEMGSLKIFPPETLDDLSKKLLDPKHDGKTAWKILCTIMEEENVTNL